MKDSPTENPEVIAAQAAGALFYTLPGDLNVNEQIDPLLRVAVAAINSSGWIWTAESCQGHPDETEVNAPWGFQIKPYLRMVCRGSHIGDASALLLEAARDDDVIATYGPPAMELYTRELRDGWMELKVYVGAHNVATRNRGCHALERFGFAAQRSQP